MAVTLAQIVARVERYVIDAPTNVATDVQFWVLQAHREIQELHNFKCMEARRSEQTTANSKSLGAISLPNFKEYRGRPYTTDSFGNSYRLHVTNSEEEIRAYFNVDEATYGLGSVPRVLHHKRPDAVGDPVEDHIWEVFPIPDGNAPTSDGNWEILIPYYSYLSDPTTSDWFTDNATDFLTHSAVAQAFAVNWDEQRYLFWRSRAYGPRYDSMGILGGDLLRAINVDKQFYISTTDVMVPYQGAREPRLGL